MPKRFIKDPFENPDIEQVSLDEIPEELMLYDGLEPIEEIHQTQFIRNLKVEANKRINPREFKVLDMRLGLVEYTDTHTYDDIAKEISVTRERVRQIILTALRKLSHPRFYETMFDENMVFDANGQRSEQVLEKRNARILITGRSGEENWKDCPSIVVEDADIDIKDLDSPHLKLLAKSLIALGFKTHFNALELKDIYTNVLTYDKSHGDDVYLIRHHNPYEANTVEAAFWAAGVLRDDLWKFGYLSELQALALVSLGCGSKTDVSPGEAISLNCLLRHSSDQASKRYEAE